MTQIGFTDAQIEHITLAATPLSLEKRGVFLSRLMANLQARGVYRHARDGDVEAAVRVALKGLLQAPAA